ncbi:MAG: alpha/beta fold hydrolase [Flavobacteriaceae bacterium]
MRLFKKILKIIGVLVLLIFIGLYWAFSSFTAPKSDEEVLNKFKESTFQPILTHEKFKGFEYRKLSIIKDTTFSNLIFVHGTIGSSTDFVEYMTDSLLLTKANMISYDRIGYNYDDKNSVQESIAFERDMLEEIVKNYNPEKTIIVGYSYGGPIALATKKKFKKIILLAPAVYSKVEPIPFMLNFYKWKLTRWLVPDVWKEASKEKMTHKKDLEKFENDWKSTPNTVISIHGNDDGIVPYSNSEFLQKQFPSNQFELIILDDTGHGLIWSNFDFIKEQFIKQLD